jgi:tRNA A37 threonylcarbamoyladenosine modification protein TsaB
MHLANAARVVAVDTLDVIAANTTDYTKEKDTEVEKIATILDAKRGQFYVAVYQHCTSDGIWKKVLPDSLMTASQVLEKFAAPDQPVWLLGVGLVHHKDKFKADGIRFLDEQYWYPRAEKVHLLGWKMAQAGQFADPLTLTPLYLRKPDVKIKS